jgi:N-acetylglucosaminylphosphatidylinositol deacetylase
MTRTWKPDDVANALSETFAPSAFRQPQPDSSGSSAIHIDVLITFDARGISSHANHISLYHGALHWLRQIDPAGSAVTMYSLTTTNILRKYISLLDAPFSTLSAVLHRLTRGSYDHYPEHLLFLSDLSGCRRAQRAMVNGHVSQMLWFRWGWIALSRYVSVNDLRRESSAVSGR